MRKENIKLSIIISLLIVASLSTTYAFLELGDTNSSAAGGTGCENVVYSITTTNLGSTITTAVLNDSYDTDNNEETTESTFIASLKDLNGDGNTTTTDHMPYTEISLKRNSDNCYQKARIYINLTEPSTNAAPIATYKALKYVILNPSGTLLKKGTIEGFGTTDLTGVDLDLPLSTETADVYTIYLWIDKNISQGYYNGKDIIGSIYAEAKQTSTINGQ